MRIPIPNVLTSLSRLLPSSSKEKKIVRSTSSTKATAAQAIEGYIEQALKKTESFTSISNHLWQNIEKDYPQVASQIQQSQHQNKAILDVWKKGVDWKQIKEGLTGISLEDANIARLKFLANIEEIVNTLEIIQGHSPANYSHFGTPGGQSDVDETIDILPYEDGSPVTSPSEATFHKRLLLETLWSHITGGLSTTNADLEFYPTHSGNYIVSYNDLSAQGKQDYSHIMLRTCLKIKKTTS